jgi:hypothetical protein
VFATKCPGQDMRYWTAEDVYEEKCPHCGEMIEFFKTDIRLRCPNCKNRVANPRFDMGCAQWCSYAEQCLGSGAKGLKTKSIRLALEDESEARMNSYPNIIEQLKRVFEKAEDLCLKNKVDLPPILAAVLTITLKRLSLIDNPELYLSSIGESNSIPQAVIKDAVQFVNRINKGEVESKSEQVIVSLLAKIETKHLV